jgi:hypothetical protein
MDIIQKDCPEAPFVKLEKGRWYSVGERTAREKIGSYFRDAVKTNARRICITKASSALVARQEDGTVS